MTDALRLPGTAPKSDRVAPLRGVLVAESERDITLRVPEGTWTFRRSDVVRVLDSPLTDGLSCVPDGITTLPDGTAPRTGRVSAAGEVGAVRVGRQVVVDVRAGATADFTRKMRIDLVDRPMAIPETPSPARGDEELRQLTERWAERLNIADLTGAHGATYTYCQTKSFATSDDGINCDSLD
ncbi:hypothetical protein [Nocardia sp. CS682]|uniref:hypothetical protein n=1 Tax=Nocardia sp. CS682 TaxID=1047172 RepID=UPI0010754D2A|nr:hypothetical protein [Nocardia sp. CS682]QBS39851.1 hypothetical protein DMB37_06590 [Nocardia sp. CS682]